MWVQKTIRSRIELLFYEKNGKCVFAQFCLDSCGNKIVLSGKGLRRSRGPFLAVRRVLTTVPATFELFSSQTNLVLMLMSIESETRKGEKGRETFALEDGITAEREWSRTQNSATTASRLTG